MKLSTIAATAHTLAILVPMALWLPTGVTGQGGVRGGRRSLLPNLSDNLLGTPTGGSGTETTTRVVVQNALSSDPGSTFEDIVAGALEEHPSGRVQITSVTLHVKAGQRNVNMKFHATMERTGQWDMRFYDIRHEETLSIWTYPPGEPDNHVEIVIPIRFENQGTKLPQHFFGSKFDASGISVLEETNGVFVPEHSLDSEYPVSFYFARDATFQQQFELKDFDYEILSN